MTSVCTIIAANYLVNALVLAESFFVHHPDGSFTVLIVDDEDREIALDEARVRWLRLKDIGLDTAEIHRLAGIYDVTELSTAVKPLLLKKLLDDGCTEAIYLDPDIVIYESLADVITLAAQHGIVLTPHIRAPFPDDGKKVDALFVLAAGAYNLGFIGIGSSARPFLDWWWQRTRRQALNDITRAMFTDQRWVDYVPSLYSHYILKDPGYNVAYWNLHERTVSIDSTDDGERYVVEGRPLRFFHFSGFDPEKPWLLSRHQDDRPRILLSEHPALARICQDYVSRLSQAFVPTTREREYGWHMIAAGFPWTARMRRLYWQAVVDAERGEIPEPPDPFDRVYPERFVAWLNTPDENGPRDCSRFLYAIYRGRVDVRAHFPNLHGADAARFADWVWRWGAFQENVPIALLPPRAADRAARASSASVFESEPRAEGLNIAGYFRSGLSVGEAARLAIDAAKAAGIPYTTHTQRAWHGPQHHPFDPRGEGDTPFDINLLCGNADVMVHFANAVGPQFFENRHTIGYWFWEVAPLPDWLHGAFGFVDEVWTATEYVAGILRRAGGKPVFTVPLPISAPVVAAGVTRAALGLPPDRFVFLFLFDFLSVFERKNPLGLIEAFTRAFAPGEGPVLVLKSVNGDRAMREVEQVRAAIAARPDIVLFDGFYGAPEKNALMASCDCYVSLHRAEGLGLTMAEAMALGKPVIATGYSGNLHFMTRENSYLVDYVPSAVPAGCEPYPAGSRWAEPDVQHAARLMREVVERPADAARVAARGREDILSRHNARVSAEAMSQRLAAIRAARKPVPVAVPVEVPETVAVDANAEADADAAAAAEAGAEAEIEVTSVEASPASETSLATDATSAASVAAESNTAPSSAAVAALEMLVPQLEIMSRPRLSADGRPWSSIRRALQRSLFRVIQPYWFQQHQYNEALADGLLTTVKLLSADIAARHAAADASQQQSRMQLEAAFAASATASHASSAALSETQTRDRSETEASIAALQDRVLGLSLIQEGQRFVQRTSDGGIHAGYGRPLIANRSDDAHAHDAYATNGNGHRNGHRNGHAPHSHAHALPIPADEPLFLTRQRLYLPLLANRTPVLDLGCGHGHMLDLLRVAKLPAFGVDANPQMVWHCRNNGHLVEEAHALHFLRTRSGADHIVGAIFSARLHDHPGFEQLQELLRLCRARLTPGGVLIAESSISPTTGETRQLRPEAVLALCRRAGFEEAQVLFHPDAGSTHSRDDAQSRGRYAVVAAAGSLPRSVSF